MPRDWRKVDWKGGLITFALGAMMAALGLTFGALLMFAISAFARPGPQWEGLSTDVRDWYRDLMQPDNPFMSCCGEADAFEADTFEIDGDHYIAIITDGKGILPPGTRITVPNQKMKWDRGNPTGHGIIFIGNQGQVYCYVAPGGV
jgi:hypothetical protein